MIVCFDIGGTAIKGAVASSPHDIRIVPRAPTPARDFDAFVAILKETIAGAQDTPACVSLSIAGVVEEDTGHAIVANIPCIHRRPLRADLENALGLPVIVSNDADCFTIAEAGIGSGRGHRVVFGAILGSGVGGGLVIDGRLINAQDGVSGGFAGEWGHGLPAATRVGNPPVDIPAFPCGCGLIGCVDAIASARGMEKLHLYLTGQSLMSEDIVARWQEEQPDASRTVSFILEILSGPLALVINLTGATIVPVGGGLSNCVPLVEALDKAVRTRILRRFDRPLVVPAACRVEPGLIGAAIIGLQAQA